MGPQYGPRCVAKKIAEEPLFSPPLPEQIETAECLSVLSGSSVAPATATPWPAEGARPPQGLDDPQQPDAELAPSAA
eukprot:5455097-Pyramimonas_sp.AAC.1